MKVLSIGTDKNMFVEGSAVRLRTIKYGEIFDELHIIVYTLQSDNLKEQQLTKNVWIYPTNSARKIYYLFDAVTLAKKKLSSFSMDVVTTQDPFETGLAGWLIARRRKIPLHIQIHTDMMSPYFAKSTLLNAVRIVIAKKLLKKADAIRVVSNRIKNSLVKISPNLLSRTTVLPIYTDTSIFRDGPITNDLRVLYPQFSFIVLMASRLTVEKNIPMALEVLRNVILKYPSAGMVIVGDGPEKIYLQALVLKYHLDKNVVFIPWQSSLVSYYRTADVFLTTSLFEGYGLTFIEAFASGCPIVSSDVGIAPEIIKEGINGFVCDVDDKKQFSDKIIFLIENPQLKSVLKEKLISDNTKDGDSMNEYLQKYKNMMERAITAKV